MSLGSRIASRGRAAISKGAKSASIPREPLHFLYPRWFGTATVAPDRDSELASAEREQDLASKDTNTKSSGGQLQGSITENALQSKNNVTESTELVGIETHQDVEHDRKIPNASPRSVARIVKAKPKPPKSPPTLFFRRHAGGIHNRAEDRAIDKAAKHAGAKAYHLQKLGEAGLIPDWRKVLQDLILHTPKLTAIWHENGLRILVPDTAIGVLLYSVNNNIWNIKARCVCEIELLEKSQNINEHRVLVLSGPATGIRNATLEILRIAGRAVAGAQNVPVPDHGMDTSSARRGDENAEGTPSKARFVRAEKLQSMRRPIRADAVPRPSQWTQTNFEEYVKHLTSIKIPGHLHSMIYSKDESHQELVQQILLSLFADASCKEAITTAALNIAISWLVARGQVRDVRVLFVHAETYGVRMDTETFNIMLRGAASNDDLRTFGFILQMMIKRHISPDSGTWLAFYRCVGDPTIKRYILEGMRKKRLLVDLKTIRAVCEELAPNEVKWSISQQHSQEQFLSHMDQRYGSDWLSTDSANKILLELGNRSALLPRVWQFLEVMISRNATPDTVTINTALGACRDRYDTDAASNIVSRIAALNHWIPDETTYQLLFDIARSQNSLPNVESVIWRYACLDASTSYPMRKKAQDIMRKTINQTAASKSRTLAGAVNGYLSLNAPGVLPGILNAKSTEELQRDVKEIAAGSLESKRQRANFLKEAMRNQLSTSKNWIAQDRFADVLQRALAIDKGGSQPSGLVPITLVRWNTSEEGLPEMCIWS